MEPEVLTKVEKIDPVAAAEEAEALDTTAGASGQTSIRHAKSHDFDNEDEDDDNSSLFEQLLDGEDETYDHIQGKMARVFKASIVR